MKPVYFPFTCVSGELIARINQYVGPFIVYQPLSDQPPAPVAEAAREGRVEFRAPVTGDEAQILDAAQRSQHWGMAHQGHMEAFRVPAGGDFYNETFAAEIRSEILGTKTPQADPAPMYTARLFLYLAQAFDMQQSTLHEELTASDRTRKQMFSDLKGDAETRLPASEKHSPEDLGEYQTRNRITSWLRLAAVETGPVPALLTTSRAVFEHILEFVPNVQIAQTFDQGPPGEAFKQALPDYWRELAEGQSPESITPPAATGLTAEAAQMQLTVAVLPASTPAELLEKLLEPDQSSPADFGKTGRILLNLLSVKKI
ncbi:MAG: hypothetical protein U5L07_11530 [Desulfobacterales bacterium]|nr:hypothetical protein [Desulfobacterales bacterium]